MRMLLRLAMAGLVVCTGVAHGADHDAQPMEAWLRARITLDESGRMTAIEWLGARKNPKLLTDRLEQEVRTCTATCHATIARPIARARRTATPMATTATAAIP